MKIIYKCDFCGQEYDTFAECSQCEYKHVMPVSIVAYGNYKELVSLYKTYIGDLSKLFPIISSEEWKTKYPTEIVIRLSDGKTLRYRALDIFSEEDYLNDKSFIVKEKWEWEEVSQAQERS